MKTAAILWPLAALALVALACDPVVGGDCAATATACGNVCCGSGSICTAAGLCAPDPADTGPADAGSDGGPSDGDVPPNDGSDAGTGDGATPDGDSGPDGGPPDGGPPNCPLGTQLCHGSCVDTDSDPSYCGSCNTSCAANELCVQGTCAVRCAPPRIVCNNLCVDAQRDPDHCGTCRTACSTNVCFSGSCVATSAGHVILIGHDFTSPQPGVGRLVGNSVLIPTGNPVRVATFAERTSAPVKAAVNAALSTTASELGRTYQFVATTFANVTQRLATVDTLLVYPQDLATDSELTSWGAQWQVALDGFVRSGGAVVVVDAGGTHAGTWQILNSAGLFAVQARSPLAAGSPLIVSNAADSVSLNVPLTFPAPANTVTFTTSATEVVVETRSMPPRPAVFHRVVRP